MAINFNSFIGPVSFHGWHGVLRISQNQHSPYQRIGSTGSGTQVTLARAPMSSIATWTLFNISTQAQSFSVGCQGLQALTYSAQDDFGRVFPRVRVHSVAVGDVKQGNGELIAAGVPALFLVRCNWTLEVLP